MRNIVGQHGEKSNAKKLLNWLVNWDRNHSGGSKPKGKGGSMKRHDKAKIVKWNASLSRLMSVSSEWQGTLSRSILLVIVKGPFCSYGKRQLPSSDRW